MTDANVTMNAHLRGITAAVLLGPFRSIRKANNGNFRRLPEIPEIATIDGGNLLKARTNQNYNDLNDFNVMQSPWN